ncbi:hypothetical protein [Desulfosporosinus sp. FKA]|uniref:hypothetical protein n=1 Tax=Desulfosporosinus sp. FKA TaxID=1969834 RepID=UPI000B4982D4|nr:hypothetical protein [Desulfosporosinus sp. FKA]
MGKCVLNFSSRRKNFEQPTKRDYPLIRENVLKNSRSIDFEEARSEWQFEQVIEEGDARFDDHCELCNHAGLETNYLVTNQFTQKSLLVGSRCIKRFIKFSGTLTQEESNDVFDRQVKQFEASKYLQKLLPNILTTPTGNEVYKFRRASETILITLKNIEISKVSWEKYLKLLFGTSHPDKELIERIRLVLFKPSAVHVKKIDKSSGTKQGQWANVTKTKKTRVTSTLSRSEAYRVGKHKD